MQRKRHGPIGPQAGRVLLGTSRGGATCRRPGYASGRRSACVRSPTSWSAWAGPVTAGIATEAAAGDEPVYLSRLREEQVPLDPDAQLLVDALRGDCHTHSDWSDGTATIEDMAGAATALGRQYLALTDHSPRL